MLKCALRQGRQALETCPLPCCPRGPPPCCSGLCPQQQDEIRSLSCSLVWPGGQSHGQQQKGSVWPSAGEGRSRPSFLPPGTQMRRLQLSSSLGYEVILRWKTLERSVSTEVGKSSFSVIFVGLLDTVIARLSPSRLLPTWERITSVLPKPVLWRVFCHMQANLASPARHMNTRLCTDRMGYVSRHPWGRCPKDPMPTFCLATSAPQTPQTKGEIRQSLQHSISLIALWSSVSLVCFKLPFNDKALV